MSKVTAFLLCFGLFALTSVAQPFKNDPNLGDPPKPFAPNDKPTLEVPKVNSKVIIDGNLDDEIWKTAAHAGNFTENSPGDRSQPPVQSDAFVAYDDENLYVAFVAYGDPSQVRASLRDRDEIFSDDYIGIILDTYGDAAWYYEFFFNPFGIQGDLIATRNNEDAGFDVIHESMGKITDKGYQIEVAIPFKSLRFPDRDEQVWRATFWRDHKRETRARYSWAATTRGESCFPCQFGYLTGIRNIKPGNALEILPSFVSTQSGNINDPDDKNSGFTNHDIMGSLSLNAKYAVSSSITAEATYNPDFSQVESDAAQIDVNSSFALFYPEKRPFFQEGSDLYGSFFDLIYTRSVNKPEFAAKITGRPDRTSFVYFVANDQESAMLIPLAETSRFISAGKTFVNNFRVKQAILEDGFLGATVTDRRYDMGGSNSVISLDGSVRFFENHRFEAQYALSVTKEAVDSSSIKSFGTSQFGRNQHTIALDGEKFNGDGLTMGYSYTSRHYNAEIYGSQLSPEFRADNGFIFKNDNKQINLWNGVNIYLDNQILEAIRPNLFVGRVWDFAGTKKDEWIGGNINLNMIGETYFNLNMMASNELYRGVQIDGIKRIGTNVNTNYFYPMRLGFFIGYGHVIKRFGTPYLGKSFDWSVWGTYKPFSELTISPEFNYSDMIHPISGDYTYKAFTFRLESKYQFTRELSLRVIVQEYFDRNFEFDSYDQGISFEPLLSYKMNPFSIFYVGASIGGRNYPTDQYHLPNSPEFSTAVNVGDYTKTSQQFFMKFQYLFQI